jgi:orotidine-5'-phosphate decarboxylase
MKKAKDYIIFPLDVPTIDEAKRFIDHLSGAVGMFKVGLELFIQCGPEIISLIHQLGKTGIFLDLKLHDIPQTVSRAMARVAALNVTFATVHCGESRSMLEAAVNGSQGKVGVLGVTVLTSISEDDIRNAGFSAEICSDMSQLVFQRAKLASETGCAGIVCSGLEAADMKKAFGLDFTIVTPGIRPQWTLNKNDDQSRVTTPTQAIENGSDYLVIGRPIRDADDPRQAAVLIAEEIEQALTNS